MATKSPSDIQSRTMEFGVRIVELVDRMGRTLASETMARQLIRSGISIGANMEEADGAETKKDFIHKVSLAYKEARESRYWLAVIRRTVMKSDLPVGEIWQEADEIVRILFAILRKSRQSAQRPAHTNP